MSTPLIHGTAKCRWCGGPFRQIFHFHWVCTTPACAQRQLAHARRKDPATDALPADGSSPYLFVPLPLGVELAENETKRLLVEGPRGTGKSVTGRWHLYAESERFPGYQSLIIRCTLLQLHANHVLSMQREEKLPGMGAWKYHERPLRMMSHDNGSNIFIGYCQDASDIGQYIGQEYDEILLEEGVQLIDAALEQIPTSDRGSAFAREVLYRVGRRSGRTRVLTNPGGRAMNHLKTFYKDKNPDRKVYDEYLPEYYGALTSTIEDNPYHDEDYKKAGFGGLKKARGAQLRDGSWDTFEGQYFSEFDPAIHVVGE
jgi:hypothetical protein